jgi:hypothetical protein
MTFNSPVEAGVRAVAVLTAAYPRAFDLQRLVAFDHLLVHTGDINGPPSLHPPVPLRSAELLVRRRLVERALLLMMTRDLVQRHAAEDGIKYVAGESAVPFLSAMQSQYIVDLQSRANWLIDALGSLPEVQFRDFLRRYFGRWMQEFQHVERSLGSEP